MLAGSDESASVPSGSMGAGGGGGSRTPRRMPCIAVHTPGLAELVDVLIVPDLDATFFPKRTSTPDEAFSENARLIEALCDRDIGVGADALVRIVPLAGDDVASAIFGGVGWFVEFWLADGSMGEMGERFRQVVGSYLGEREHCEPGMISVATFAGVRLVQVPEYVVLNASA